MCQHYSPSLVEDPPLAEHLKPETSFAVRCYIASLFKTMGFCLRMCYLVFYIHVRLCQ